jgi:hypothetical protein
MSQDREALRVITEKHRRRHVELHRALDELVADWVLHQPRGKLCNSTIMELIEWSHRQTIKPAEIESDEPA